jgi:hypothetical protein
MGKPWDLIPSEWSEVDSEEEPDGQKPYCLASSVRGTYRTPYIFFLVTLPWASLSMCQISLRTCWRIMQIWSATRSGSAFREDQRLTALVSLGPPRV